MSTTTYFNNIMTKSTRHVCVMGDLSYAEAGVFNVSSPEDDLTYDANHLVVPFDYLAGSVGAVSYPLVQSRSFIRFHRRIHCIRV